MSWITLCLTPLVVHIFAGAPAPILLMEDSKPPWYDRICHLNPTSIFWRYYTITIRGFSTKVWKRDDMAATNAVFWTGKKWNGSEDMMIKSRKFITRRPEGTRVPLMSASAVKTLLVTLQGVQAMYGLIRGLNLGGYALRVAFPNIFLPLALAGLYRLPASLWLTEEYGYRTMSPEEALELEELELKGLELEESEVGDLVLTNKLCSKKKWRVIAVKTFFLGTIAVLCALSIYYFKPNPRVTSGTASTLTINLFYTIFLFVTFVTVAVYTAKGESNTTIIPCISSTWYRIYTYLLFLLALWLVIASALETRITACGENTTYAAKLGFDHFIC